MSYLSMKDLVQEAKVKAEAEAKAKAEVKKAKAKAKAKEARRRAQKEIEEQEVAARNALLQEQSAAGYTQGVAKKMSPQEWAKKQANFESKVNKPSMPKGNAKPKPVKKIKLVGSDCTLNAIEKGKFSRRQDGKLVIKVKPVEKNKVVYTEAATSEINWKKVVKMHGAKQARAMRQKMKSQRNAGKTSSKAQATTVQEKVYKQTSQALNSCEANKAYKAIKVSPKKAVRKSTYLSSWGRRGAAAPNSKEGMNSKSTRKAGKGKGKGKK